MPRHRTGADPTPLPGVGAGCTRRRQSTWQRLLALFVAASAIILLGCGSASESASESTDEIRATTTSTPNPATPNPADDGTPPERPTVAVTTNILADITRAIAGDDIEVIDLMPRGADPHSYALSAADADRVTRSDLIVANGLGLEEGIVGVLDRATDGGVPIVEVGPALDPLEYASGDEPDPHVWTDPRRVVTAVELLTTELTALVAPDAAERIEESAAAYIDELDALDTEIAGAVAQLAPDRRRLVTNHHVLGYFADRYGFEILGAVIPSGTTLASPSAADLAELSGVIRDSGVPAIFAETSQPDRLVEVLAEEVGLDITVADLYSESLGDPTGPAGTYLDMMRYNATTIIEALSARSG